MAKDALEVVKLRRNFYRDSYRIVIILLFVALLVIAGLVWVVSYQASHKPTPKYFATTTKGTLIPLVPLSSPNLNNQSVIAWVTTAATNIYDYSFMNYRTTFNRNQQYFTTGGWNAFLGQLRNSKTINKVIQDKLIVQGSPTGVPVITRQYDDNGVYTWAVQLPFVISYTGPGGVTQQDIYLDLTLKRLSTLSSAYGMGISALVEAPRTGAS